eukprot:5722317-Pyramimonas_sp.AAC.1
MRGTRRACLKSSIEHGLSCRAEQNPRGRHGRQFVRRCPCLPGDARIRPGLRRGTELYMLISIPRLLRDGAK